MASTVLGPTILDLQTAGPFNTYTPPAGWTDTGWIKDFKITPASKIGKVRSGYRGAVRAQYRGEVGATFEFKFRESARMQYKLATGSNPFNLLSGATPTTVGPLSASGSPKTAMVSYVAGPPAVLTVASAGAIGLSGGSYIVCDADYLTSQTGLVGSVGIPLQPGQVTDVDFVRKTSDFVARVVSIVGDTTLNLDQPFVGGGNSATLLAPGYATPPAGSKVQQIEGWAVREGGTFISEWSGLFVMDTEDAAQIAVYYPHVSISQFRDIGAWTLENQGTTDQTGYELDAVFETLAFDDPLDGETIVGYYAYYPRPHKYVK